jgi:hypothetical protein
MLTDLEFDEQIKKLEEIALPVLKENGTCHLVINPKTNESVEVNYDEMKKTLAEIKEFVALSRRLRREKKS